MIFLVWQHTFSSVCYIWNFYMLLGYWTVLFYSILLLLYIDQHWGSTATCAAALGLIVTGSVKTGLIDFLIECIWLFIAWHVSIMKFGQLTLLTWFYTWETFCNNRLNTLWVVANWSWKSRKAIRLLFVDLVTICLDLIIVIKQCHNNNNHILISLLMYWAVSITGHTV